jgi:CRISPR system Cascade subunit CasC
VNIAALLSGAKLKTEPPKNEGDQPKTQYLLYLPQRKLQELVDIVDTHWDALTDLAGASTPAEANNAEGEKTADKAKKGKKAAKAQKAGEVPKEAKDAVTKLFRDAKQTPEIALFGRMIADNPDWNVEAACQVAHAISTHRISMEFDFFTAVDDLKKDSDTGSDMMGTVQFNSACFYRYAVVDVDGLQANLGGTEQSDLTQTAIKAFLQAFVHARPTGKQNSMAANTLPSLVLFTVREGGQAVSLVNAFTKPVVVRGNSDLESGSGEQLAKHFADLRKMYPGGLQAAHACSLGSVEWGKSVTTHDSVEAAIAAACSALSGKAKAA